MPPYEGPFKVLDHTEKTFTVAVNGRMDIVPIDSEKPAYMPHPDISFTSLGLNCPIIAN